MREVLKLCEQLISEGRHYEAIAKCDRALQGRLTQGQECQILQVKARALVAVDGRWQGEAVQCLRRALQLSKPGTDRRAQILATFTAAYAALGNAVGCKRSRDEFHELYQSSPNSVRSTLRPYVEYNLAVSLHDADRIDEAEDAYLLARAACDQATDPVARDLSFHIDHNLVDIFQELERHREAYSLMVKAHPHLPEATHGAQMRNRRAIYAMSQGDLPAARLWAESGLAHPSCDTKTRAALLLTKARIAAALGQADEAHDIAAEAWRMAAIAQCCRLQSRVLSFLKSV